MKACPSLDLPELVRIPGGVRDYLALPGADARVEQMGKRLGIWGDVESIDRAYRAWIILATYQARHWKNLAMRREKELEKTPGQRDREHNGLYAEALAHVERQRQRRRKFNKAAPRLGYDWLKDTHTLAGFRDATGRTQKTILQYVSGLDGQRKLDDGQYQYSRKAALTVLDRWLDHLSAKKARDVADEIWVACVRRSPRRAAPLRMVLSKHGAKCLWPEPPRDPPLWGLGSQVK